MRKMKDSGIEWIGQIPQEWNTNRIKYVYEIISGNGFKEHLQGNSTGDYPFYKVSDINGVGRNVYHAANYVSKNVVSEYRFSVVPAGALIMSKIGEALKKNHRKITSVDCVVDNNLQALVPIATIDARYFFYQFLCIDMAWFDNGGTIPSVNNQKLLDFRIASPSISVQKRIADYLDSKCNEIDALIAAKEKTNALLKERRQSIIYEAVTKGLNPDAPMKDSGIEWIGEIPVHWEVERLKHHIEFNPKTEIPEYGEDDSVSFIPMDCLRRGVHTSQTVDYSKVKSGYVDFAEGDILMAKVTPCLENGNLAIAGNLIDGVGFGSTEINVIRCKSIHREYLFYILQCKTYVDRAVADMYGVAGLKRLNPSFIPNTKYPMPSIEEQQKIAEYLAATCGEIDELVVANERTIEKLKEYRQSVIYEAVTGKIEI